MGKSKKIDDIKKDKGIKPIPKGDMNKITGGKNGNKDKKKHNNGCGGILPQ